MREILGNTIATPIAVPSWARQSTKPSYTYDEVGADKAGAADSALQAAKDYTDHELATFDFIKVMDGLPAEGLSNKIYLVPKQDSQTKDLFDEYIWVDGAWEWITTKPFDVDLTSYVEKETGKGLSTNDYTTAEKTKLAGLSNYTLPNAGASLGGIKTGGDLTITDGVATVNDDSHNHIIANVDGLQAELNNKALSSAKTIDSTMVAVKDVPMNACPYAEVVEVGGMTRKCTNLIPYPYKHTTRTENGITFTDNGDGTVTVNGTSTGVAEFRFIENNLFEDGKTYTISGTKGDISVDVLFAGVTWAGKGTFTVTKDMLENSTAIRTLIRIPKGVSVSNITVYPMLNEGSVALPYEPYFEGLRSAPVTEVESVGVNLFDYKSHIKNGLTSVIKVIPNKTLYRNAQIGNKSSWEIYDNADALIGTFSSFNFNASNPMVLPSNAAYIKTTDDIHTLVNFYLGYGSDTTYTPYTKTTLPIPEAVRALDGYGLGIDDTLYNYIDLGKKQFVRRVKKQVFNGSEDWVAYVPSSTGDCTYYRCKIGKLDYAKNDIALSSSYDCVDISYSNANVGVDIANSSSYSSCFVYVRPADYADMTTSKWKEYLGSNPLTVLYALTTPEIVDISDILPDDNLIAVEGGGTITMVNEYGYEVPSEVTYYTKSADILAADTLVGSLDGTASRAICDAYGNNIAATYVTKEDLQNLITMVMEASY